MVNEGPREGDLPMAEAVATVTREDLNEAIASLKISMTIEVKSLFKELPRG
jgi:hypothetical protein